MAPLAFPVSDECSSNEHSFYFGTERRFLVGSSFEDSWKEWPENLSNKSRTNTRLSFVIRGILPRRPAFTGEKWKWLTTAKWTVFRNTKCFNNNFFLTLSSEWNTLHSASMLTVMLVENIAQRDLSLTPLAQRVLSLVSYTIVKRFAIVKFSYQILI